MTIRQLKPEELPRLVPLALGFWEEGKLPGRFNGVAFARTWIRMIDSGAGAIFGMFDGEIITGAIGGIIYPDPNVGDLVATEFFWYVSPDRRGRGILLLKEFEKWAKSGGAQRVIMVHLTKCMPEKVAGIYTKMGYEPIETHYMKEF